MLPWFKVEFGAHAQCRRFERNGDGLPLSTHRNPQNASRRDAGGHGCGISRVTNVTLRGGWVFMADPLRNRPCRANVRYRGNTVKRTKGSCFVHTATDRLQAGHAAMSVLVTVASNRPGFFISAASARLAAGSPAFGCTRSDLRLLVDRTRRPTRCPDRNREPSGNLGGELRRRGRQTRFAWP